LFCPFDAAEVTEMSFNIETSTIDPPHDFIADRTVGDHFAQHRDDRAAASFGQRLELR
jgi:hypothetical protein